MRLYHYTSEDHLEYVLGLGVLLTTESNIGAPDFGRTRTEGWQPVGDHIGPDVVWLTDLENAALAGITTDSSYKGAIRVVVQVPDSDVQHWPPWAEKHGIDPGWYAALSAGCEPDRFWIVERPIPHTEWEGISGPPSAAPRNSPCPCGGGKKFKHCHLGRRTEVWKKGDGITQRYSEAEVRSRSVQKIDLTRHAHPK